MQFMVMWCRLRQRRASHKKALRLDRTISISAPTESGGEFTKQSKSKGTPNAWSGPGQEAAKDANQCGEYITH